MYLFDFKHFFVLIMLAAWYVLAVPVSAQPGPFSGPTKLVAPAVATKVPDFEFANINGGRLKSSDMKGKVIIIRFWATW